MSPAVGYSPNYPISEPNRNPYSSYGPGNDSMSTRESSSRIPYYDYGNTQQFPPNIPQPPIERNYYEYDNRPIENDYYEKPYYPQRAASSFPPLPHQQYRDSYHPSNSNDSVIQSYNNQRNSIGYISPPLTITNNSFAERRNFYRKNGRGTAAESKFNGQPNVNGRLNWSPKRKQKLSNNSTDSVRVTLQKKSNTNVCDMEIDSEPAKEWPEIVEEVKKPFVITGIFL